MQPVLALPDPHRRQSSLPTGKTESQGLFENRLRRHPSPQPHLALTPQAERSGCSSHRECPTEFWLTTGTRLAVNWPRQAWPRRSPPWTGSPSPQGASFFTLLPRSMSSTASQLVKWPAFALKMASCIHFPNRIRRAKAHATWRLDHTGQRASLGRLRRRQRGRVSWRRTANW